MEFKMAVTEGFQDISSMYKALENPYVYILYVNFIVLQTYCKGSFGLKLSFWVNNQIKMKSTLCRHRHVYASIKEVHLFLHKHVKSEKKAYTVVYS